MAKEHLQEICNRAQAFHQAQVANKQRIEENRNYWNATTKDLILTTFREIATKVPNLNWDIQLIEQMENLDVVNLGFKSESSGIVGMVKGMFKFFNKESGRLIYNQVFNGEIYANITYPHVEHHTAQQQPKFIGKFNPQDISEDLILDHVKEFLDEMETWETGTRKIIGFN